MRLLSITFSNPIQPWEIPAFRGAVADKVGYEHDLFHNHDNSGGLETNEFIHRYPLVQYKQHRGKPMMLCIDAGVDAVQHLFAPGKLDIEVGGKPLQLQVEKLDLREHRFESNGEILHFHLRDWLALNEDNYEQYGRCRGLVEQLGLLEKVLSNQLVALCHALGHHPPEPLDVRILDLQSSRWATYKKIKLRCFTLQFSVQLDLPMNIGIGKGSSTGWGVIRKL